MSDASHAHADDDLRDELPEDLNAVEHTLPYEFPDNSRRRKPGVLYLVVAAACLALWLTLKDDSALVNNGFLWAAILLGAAAPVAYLVCNQPPPAEPIGALPRSTCTG